MASLWEMVTMHRAAILARFYARVEIKPDNVSCWGWQGGVFGDGYGCTSFAGRTVRATHLAYALAHGEVPTGLYVLHRCDNPRCVRPTHLWAGTQAENMADMVSKGRGVPRERMASVLHPEWFRGERHWTRRYPERLARGARHGQHTRPDRTARGERQGNSKLTRAAVDEMRQLRAQGVKLRELAARFGVSESQVSAVCRGRSWREEMVYAS